ncbi:MAG: hypothetical protein ACXWWV_02445, partial [Candidatus Deferrimicrobiaceae bacterium]
MYRKVALQFVSVLLTVMVTAIGMCFAAEKKKAVKQEQVQTKRMTVKELKEEYATKPFDAKVATLPPGYLGHDIVALYERLSKAFPPKDEFESTEAYQKRLQGGYPQGNLAFLVENRFAMISASYDPDVQNMLIKINADRAMNLDGFTERLRKTRKSSNYDPLS